MATITASPSQPSVGQPVLLTGDDFTAGATVTVEVNEEGWESQVVADASGSWGTTDVADHATTTLTGHVLGADVTADQTVTIGDVVYTFKANPTGIANGVKIGATADVTLANLKAAINASGTANTEYGAGTVVNPKVRAGVLDAGAFTLKLHARTGGTAGNSHASTTNSTHLTFPGATFNSGTAGSASTGLEAVSWIPTRPGTFHVRAADSVLSATLSVQVWE